MNRSTTEGARSPWLTPPAAAEYLGVALGTLRNWTSSGRVPHARRSRVVRYHRAELDDWLRGGTTGAAALVGSRPAARSPG